jgi:hypothetical protein
MLKPTLELLALLVSHVTVADFSVTLLTFKFVIASGTLAAAAGGGVGLLGGAGELLGTVLGVEEDLAGDLVAGAGAGVGAGAGALTV